MAEPKHAAGATYTDQEMLDLAREALARALKVGIEYAPGQFRKVRRSELADLEAAVARWEQRVAAASGFCVNLARMK